MIYDKRMLKSAYLPDRLCEWYSDMPEFAYCHFTTRFPPFSKSTPVTDPIVVFGVKSVKVDSAYEETEEERVRNVTAKETFSMNMHIPKDMGESDGWSLLDRLLELLVFHTELDVTNVEVKQGEYKRNTDSVLIEVTFTVTDTAVPGDAVCNESFTAG